MAIKNKIAIRAKQEVSESSLEALSPCDVRTTREVMRLQRSAWDGKGFWMLVNHDGSVNIHEQSTGEPSKSAIKIPRRTFLAMVDWYQRRQNPFVPK